MALPRDGMFYTANLCPDDVLLYSRSENYPPNLYPVSNATLCFSSLVVTSLLHDLCVSLISPCLTRPVDLHKLGIYPDPANNAVAHEI